MLMLNVLLINCVSAVKCPVLKVIYKQLVEYDLINFIYLQNTNQNQNACRIVSVQHFQKTGT